MRLVVGHWRESPWGDFADVMVEDADGHRVLLAPHPRVADFVAATYTFDEVRIEDIELEGVASGFTLRSKSLNVHVGYGKRTPLGRILRLVPRQVATAPAWCAVTDPIARMFLRGVRTRGTAGGGRRECYGATDIHAVVSVTGTWADADLGDLAPVDPPCRFGFSSVPPSPSRTHLVTTVRRG
ncbi:hypothetical protein [Demetria terragena]|uniref:hypothetical protein n=1 Tax=Demetria terragena TaxID=63959 RepID=UPI001FDF7826|nr:hypothetical protein [Demetria terragena]